MCQGNGKKRSQGQQQHIQKARKMNKDQKKEERSAEERKQRRAWQEMLRKQEEEEKEKEGIKPEQECQRAPNSCTVISTDNDGKQVQQGAARAGWQQKVTVSNTSQMMIRPHVQVPVEVEHPKIKSTLWYEIGDSE